jgi:hypothetical protein
MIPKSMVGRLLTMSLILGGSVIAVAQTQAAERESFPQRGSEKYWLVVDEFADRTVHFAYAKRFLEVYGGPLTPRQCQQYSRIAVDYADQLATVKQARVSGQTGFWNDVRSYSISMIGPPGVPIPLHRTSNYWVTTGSEAEDRDLRRIVSVEIDEASSQLVPTTEYSPSGLNPECRNAGQEPTAKAQQ